MRGEFERRLAEEPEERRSALRKQAETGGGSAARAGDRSLMAEARKRLGVSGTVAKRDAQIERIVTKYLEMERWAQRPLLALTSSRLSCSQRMQLGRRLRRLVAAIDDTLIRNPSGG